MPKNTYAYIRVSSRDQNLARQYAALAPCGIPDKNIFADKKSGKDFNRPAYQRLLRRIKPGDTLFIPSIDRLGRNYAEILDQWAILTKKKHIDIVVLDMPLLDTRTKSDSLTGTFIADLVLQILSYVAETERAHIRERQRAGIAAAKARGMRFGRPKNPLPASFFPLAAEFRAGNLTCAEAASRAGMSYWQFYYHVRNNSAGIPEK